MTATTPNYAIPYPEITDFVKDGATAMEAIAEKVDDILSTGAAARNLLYNGAMQVTQRGVGPVTSLTTGDYRTADRWYENIITQGTWTNSVETDAPTGSGFRKSLKMLCTTIDASPVGTDEVTVDQKLEGQDLQAIRKGTSSAQQLTLSFWVKANLTGTYVAMLYDLDNARFCSKSYTINASATWEYKTLTFPADTTGAFDNDNAASLLVRFYLGAGTNFTGGTLQTTWGTDTTANRCPGQVNLAATANNYWQITGTQLTIGTATVPFQFKSYQQDLRECQRYFHIVGTGDLHGSFYGGTASMLFSHLPVTMRTSPTATIPAGPYTNALLDYGVAFRTPSNVQTQSATANNYAIVAYNGFTYTYIPTTWYGANIPLSAELV